MTEAKFTKAEKLIMKEIHETGEYFWKDLLNPRRAEGQLLRPVMPLKKGHIAMLMASGMMGVVRLKDQQGKTLLVKGRVVKVQEVVAGDHDDEGNGEDGDGSDTEIIRDRFVTTVATVQQSGIKVISELKIAYCTAVKRMLVKADKKAINTAPARPDAKLSNATAKYIKTIS